MAKKVPTADECLLVSGILKTLAHPQRLMILCQLADGPKSVSELEELSGASQSAVSQFLSRMKSEGLVNVHREHQYLFYDIKDARIKKLLQALDRIFCGES